MTTPNQTDIDDDRFVLYPIGFHALKLEPGQSGSVKALTCLIAKGHVAKGHKLIVPNPVGLSFQIDWIRWGVNMLGEPYDFPVTAMRFAEDSIVRGLEFPALSCDVEIEIHVTNTSDSTQEFLCMILFKASPPGQTTTAPR